ncbi:MAG: DUF929 family protein [Candidatus Micrarchaeia archaeon]
MDGVDSTIPIKKQNQNLSTIILAITVIIMVALLYEIYAVSSLSSQVKALNSEVINANKTSSLYMRAIFSLLANKTLAPLPSYNISSSLITPNISLAGFPVITQNQPFGHRLTNINQPFNSSELSIINNAPDSYFEKAGEMLLNGTLKNPVGSMPLNGTLFIVNGKPTVIYFGSITCTYCSENKWSMALALSRFGNFSELFKGYSSFGDADLPTLYFAPSHYSESAEDLGNFYNSKYINFISIEDTNNITSGFNLNPLQLVQQRINATGNLAYKDAFSLLMASNDFSGTPFTLWGKYFVNGADAVAFGNSTPTNRTIPLEYMTHADVLNQIAAGSSQFSMTEYAGADFYIALLCKSINNTAPACTGIPVISKLESAIKLS